MKWWPLLLFACTPPSTATMLDTLNNPKITAFTASATTLPPGGGKVTFTQAATDATVLYIDQSVGDVLGKPSIDVMVTATTVFTLSAVNAKGSDTLSVTVAVQPAITTFTADRMSLPYGGGDVLFAWQSTEAASADLSPGTGSVTTSGYLSVHVTATTTYTLTTTGPGGMASAMIPITVSTTRPIAGRVEFDAAGLPVSSANVMILETGAVTSTDGDGKFSFDAAPVPYSLAVSIDSSEATVYRGLTRQDPVIIPIGSTPTTSHQASHINGVISGLAGASLPQVTVTYAETWPASVSSANCSNTSGDYNLSFPTWYGDTWSDGVLFAFHLPSHSFASVPLTIAEGGLFDTRNLTLAVVTSFTLSQTATPPAGYSLTWQRTGMELAAGGVAAVTGDTGDVLVVPDSYGYVAAHAENGGNFLESVIGNFSAAASGVVVPLPPAPTLLTPDDGSTGSTFSWSAIDATTVYVVTATINGLTLRIVTTDTSATLPDTSKVSAGVESGASSTWVLATLAPFTSMDQLADGKTYRLYRTRKGVTHVSTVGGARAFTTP